MRALRVNWPARRDQQKDADGGAPAFDEPLADRSRLDMRLDQAVRGFGKVNGARLRELLHPRRQVRGVANRGVVHPEVVADSTDDHLASVQSHPDGDAAVDRPRAFELTLARGMLDGERGERRTAGVIFVGRRRAEQCHETVTEKLIDGPFVSVDFRHRDGKELVQKGMHSFRADARGQRRRSGQIAEKHGHQLALAFDGRWRAEEVRPKVRRCVSRDSADARGCGMLAHRIATCAAELRGGRIDLAAGRAGDLQRGAAFIAEGGVDEVWMGAPWTIRRSRF